jgi:hypothetical protein
MAASTCILNTGQIKLLQAALMPTDEMEAHLSQSFGEGVHLDNPGIELWAPGREG